MTISKIRNPNVEIRNNFKARKPKNEKPLVRISCSRFEFVSDFDIRISDFSLRKSALS